MTGGWIKLHRQIKDSVVYQHSHALHIWVECLLRASHDSRSVLLKRQKIALEPGQFVMGYREFAKLIGCSVSTVKHWMDFFEAERMVERSTTPKGSLVKLLNWNDYQEAERKPERQANAERTLSEPNKKEKNVKNDKNTTVSQILKWFGEMSIGNPDAYYRKMMLETNKPAVLKAWGEIVRGSCDPTPAEMFARARRYAARQKPGGRITSAVTEQ
jgi:hypothetical protein